MIDVWLIKAAACMQGVGCMQEVCGKEQYMERAKKFRPY